MRNNDSFPRAVSARLTTAGLWLAAAGVPLAWSQAVAGEYTLPKLAALGIGEALCLLGLFAGQRWGEGWFRRPTALDDALAIAFAALVVSSLRSRDPALSLLGRYDSYAYGLWPMALLAGVFYSAALGLDEKVAARTLGVCLGVSVLAAAYGIAQVAGVESFSRVRLPNGRAVSTLGSAVDLGAYLVATTPLALKWTLEGRKSKALGSACLAALCGGLLATGSRGAWLGAASGAALFFLLRTQPGAFERPKPSLRSRAPLWAGAALAGAVVIGLMARQVAARPVIKADAARWEIWKTAWHVFKEHPWLGSGPDTFEQEFRRHRTDGFVRSMRSTTALQAYAHNDFLQALSTTGLLGTAAYLYTLAALAVVAKGALKNPATRDVAAAVAAGLFGVFVNMKFNPVALEVLVQAALLAGALCSISVRPQGRLRLSWPFLCLLSFGTAGSLAYTKRLWDADRAVKLARIEQASLRLEPAAERFRKALVLNPCEPSYQMQLVNHIPEMINATQDRDVRANLLREAVGTGLAAVRCHPNDVNSHYIAGYASLLAAELGITGHYALAEQHFDEALRLDPTFLPLLELRLSVAARVGDAAGAARLKEKIRMLESWTNP